MLFLFAKFLLRVFGWHTEGELPNIPKYVIIGAPHTSNWDFVLMLVLVLVYRVKVSWMGKASLFRWPFGLFFKRLGGIPIDRSSRHNVVDQAIQAFDANERLILLLTPEGTRKKVKSWKTGFYYIAKGANVPIVLAFVDYKRKAAGPGSVLMPSGDIEADMQIIREFYSGVSGKHPDQAGEIRVAAKRDT